MADEEDKAKGKDKRFTKEFVEKYSKTTEKEVSPEEVILEKQKKLLEENPKNTRLWYANGLLLMEMGRNEEALRSLEKVTELEPGYLGVWNARAEVLRRLGRNEEAAQSLKKALEFVGPKVDEKFRQVMERADEEEKPEEVRPPPEETIPPERVPKKPPEKIPEKIPEIIPEVIEEVEPEGPPKEAPKELPEEVEEEIKKPPKPPEEPEGVEVVGPPDETTDEETELRKKMELWEAQGYNIEPLKETLVSEPYKARTAFFQFEQNLAKIAILKETLDGITAPGFEDDIARIKEQMKSPYNMWKVEAEMGDLLSRIEVSRREIDGLGIPSVELPPPEPPKKVMPRPSRTMPLRTAEGRVNGLTGLRGRPPTPGGRTNGLVNGLVNGLQSARRGMTNGLTDPKGFTNGLGSPRFHRDMKVRRWKLLLVPVLTSLLLLVPVFNVPLAGTPPLLGGIVVDGNPADWTGIPAYNQTQDVPEDSVNITSYRTVLKDDRLSFLVEVKGQPFRHVTRTDSIYAFIDVDGIRLTGYDMGNFGADFLVEISGRNNSLSTTLLSTFFDSNPDGSSNWSAWRNLGGVNAAFSGRLIEFQLEKWRLSYNGVDFSESQYEVMLVSDNNGGITGTSAVRMGAQFGALLVRQKAVNNTIGSSGYESFLDVEFEAIGSTVHVNRIDFTRSPLAVLVNPPADFDVFPGSPLVQSIIVDTRTAPMGELLTMEVSRVDASHPVSLMGEPGRTYVGSIPSGKEVDGIFVDWSPAELQTDTDSGNTYPTNLDIVKFGTNRSSSDAFFYLDVKGRMMAGSKVVKVYEYSIPTPAPPSTPKPPGLRKGHDFVRVFVDSDSTNGQGLPIHGLLGADYLIEVTGIHGKIKQKVVYRWTGNSWQQYGLVKAENGYQRMEIGMDTTAITVNQMQVAFESSDWRRMIDSTTVSAVRSRSSSLDGESTIYETFYGVTLPNEINVDKWIRYSAGPNSLEWELPDEIVFTDGDTRKIAGEIKRTELEVEECRAVYRDIYTNNDIDVLYEIEDSSLKELFIIKTPFDGITSQGSGTIDLMFKMKPSENLMVYLSGDGSENRIETSEPIRFIDRHDTAFLIPPAMMWDANGHRIPVPYIWEKTTPTLSIEVPVDYLLSASYPVYIDPWVNYTYKNLGPLNGTSFGERTGTSVAIGDFNNDGYADLLTGAPYNAKNVSNGGAAYIFFGPLENDETEPDVNIPGNLTGYRRGYAVAAGKLNDDDYWDAVVTQYVTDAPTNIYYGEANWPKWRMLPDVNISYQALGGFSGFGFSVATGNFNNTYYDDIVIGAPFDTSASPNFHGRAYVFMSPFQANVTTPNFTLLPQTDSSGKFGYSIATGLVDSDSNYDIVLGEPDINTQQGRISFFKGSSLTGSGNKQPNNYINGNKSLEKFGWSVSVGKLNSDDYNDIAVGAPCNGIFPECNGKVYLFLADSNGISTGQIPDAEVTNQSTNEEFGSAVHIGPIYSLNPYNLAVGATKADAGGTDRGKTYIFETPLTSSAPLWEQSGYFDNENLGSSLAGGKFSNDDFYRLAIGAPRYLIESANAGRVVILSYIPEFQDVTIIAFMTIGLGLLIGRRKRRKTSRSR